MTPEERAIETLPCDCKLVLRGPGSKHFLMCPAHFRDPMARAIKEACDKVAQDLAEQGSLNIDAAIANEREACANLFDLLAASIRGRNAKP